MRDQCANAAYRGFSSDVQDRFVGVSHGNGQACSATLEQRKDEDPDEFIRFAYARTDREQNPSQSPPSALYEHAIRHEKEAIIAENGALVAYSGEQTGRSPKDKRIVRNPSSEKEVWWGTTNVPLDPKSYAAVRQWALDYLNVCERLYCFDGFAGWDLKYRIKVRVICTRPYHALFMHTMLIRPTPEELASFGQPDFLIYNAGTFPADRLMPEVA